MSSVKASSMSSAAREGVVDEKALRRRASTNNLSRLRSQATQEATDQDLEHSLTVIRFCVRTWRSRRRSFRQAVREEVARRRQQNGSALLNSEYTPQNAMLRELHSHTETSVERALNNMAQNRRHSTMRAQAVAVQRLLNVLDALSRLGAVRTEAQLCIETAAMLCDVLDCGSCDLYPVASAHDAGGRFETYVLVGSKRVPVNVKHTAFLARPAQRAASGDSRAATIIADVPAELREAAAAEAEATFGRDASGARAPAGSRGSAGGALWYRW